MAQEDKELLLKDLCARLPYGVKVRIEGDYFYDEREPYDTTLKSEVLGHLIADVYSVKPYLRPMSSMTEEELKEILRIDYAQIYTGNCWSWKFANYKQIDWLNEHHFDYRGLIEKGLALEAPEGMYKININAY